MNSQLPHYAQLQQRLWCSPLLLNRLRDSGATPNDLGNTRALPFLPRLQREDLRDHLDEIIAIRDERDLQTLGWVNSSGTRGMPLRIPRNRYDLQIRKDIYLHLLKVHGVVQRRKYRGVFLCSLDYAQVKPGYTLDYPELSITRITVQDAHWQFKLQTIQPDIIFTNPTGIELLLHFANTITPLAVFSTAMQLPIRLRDQAQHILHCPIINVYSTTESGPVAWQCTHSPEQFHVITSLFHVWQEHQHLYISRFNDSILPLLNYHLDDVAELVSRPCCCGHDGQSLLQLQGRTRSEKSQVTLTRPAAVAIP